MGSQRVGHDWVTFTFNLSLRIKITIKLVKIKKLRTLSCWGHGNEHSHVLLVEKEINTALGRAIWNTEQNLKCSAIPPQRTYLTGESESRSVMSDSLWPHGLYSPWNSPGQTTGVDSHSLLQGIFPTQGSNPGLPHCRRILYQMSHQGSPVLQVFCIYAMWHVQKNVCNSKRSVII